VLAGASSFAAISDWLHDMDEHARARLGFEHGPPVGTTAWRLLTRLDADSLASGSSCPRPELYPNYMIVLRRELQLI
jgi:hypothetical protein